MQFEAFVRFYLRVGPHLDVVMTDEVLGTIDRLIRLLFREVIFTIPSHYFPVLYFKRTVKTLV